MALRGTRYERPYDPNRRTRSSGKGWWGSQAYTRNETVFWASWGFVAICGGGVVGAIAFALWALLR